MKNIFETRTIKVPSDKISLLMRGCIISRGNFTIDGDFIIIPDMTFGIAKRIIKFSNVYVSNSQSSWIYAETEDELEKAFEVEEIFEDDDKDYVSEKPMVVFDESVKNEDSENLEETITSEIESPIAEEEEIYNSEEDIVEIPTDDIIESDIIEINDEIVTVDDSVNCINKNNYHKNKKHR